MTEANRPSEKPEWIRLPKPGERCIHTGLSRSTMNELVIPSDANDYLPPVRSAVIKKRGAMRGIRLISYDSLMGYINGLCEIEFDEGEAA
ncbi:hypothetical protein [Pontiella sulfatireligans]|uniref:Uncharacterized protein n=1 Tax=Pontiella sulfatireligans TaxID=2750658 RepID=A0A6C2UFC4_9BACT|nr:hypothetical protein [Pontiella sulfatireligans]VGO18227.1 hypothetical protein SCARR_00278 [Pontiella sulfatireligans]